MGGVSILLFGIIASSGLRMLIDNKVDFGKNRNLAIASVILVLGIGGAFIQVSERFTLQGMALCCDRRSYSKFSASRKRKIGKRYLLKHK